MWKHAYNIIGWAAVSSKYVLNCSSSSFGSKLVCLLFYVLETLRSYQDGYWLVTAHSQWLNSAATLGDRPGGQHYDTLSWHRTNESLTYPKNAECLARKRQVSIIKSLVWLSQLGSNPLDALFIQPWNWGGTEWSSLSNLVTSPHIEYIDQPNHWTRFGKALAACAEGQEFETHLSQTNDLQKLLIVTT